VQIINYFLFQVLIWLHLGLCYLGWPHRSHTLDTPLDICKYKTNNPELSLLFSSSFLLYYNLRNAAKGSHQNVTRQSHASHSPHSCMSSNQHATTHQLLVFEVSYT